MEFNWCSQEKNILLLTLGLKNMKKYVNMPDKNVLIPFGKIPTEILGNIKFQFNFSQKHGTTVV